MAYVPGSGGGGAPTTADYLVGTTNGDLSAEIVVGTTPGGEFGGTWASPTVDGTHSGSSHADAVTAAEAYSDTALSGHESDATDAHDASAVTFTPDGTFWPAGDAQLQEALIHHVDGTNSNPHGGISGTYYRLGATLINYTDIDFAQRGIKPTYWFRYLFAGSGGATGTIPLEAMTGAMPSGFIIQNVFVYVRTALAGGVGSTAALTSGESANDIVTATVVAGAPWSSTGKKGTQVLFATLGTWIEMVAGVPAIVIGVNDLTDGYIDVYIDGFVQ